MEGPLCGSLWTHEVQPCQPRSQALSSLLPLVVERKTLVAAGHVTTQNLGGKKSVWQEGWQSDLIVVVVNLVGVKASSNCYPLYRGLMWNFAAEEYYIISAVSKI